MAAVISEVAALTSEVGALTRVVAGWLQTEESHGEVNYSFINACELLILNHSHSHQISHEISSTKVGTRKTYFGVRDVGKNYR